MTSVMLDSERNRVLRVPKSWLPLLRAYAKNPDPVSGRVHRTVTAASNVLINRSLAAVLRAEHGDAAGTAEATAAQMRQAMQLSLPALPKHVEGERGRPNKREDGKVRETIRLPEDMHATLSALARRKGVDLERLVVAVLRKAMPAAPVPAAAPAPVPAANDATHTRAA